MPMRTIDDPPVGAAISFRALTSSPELQEAARRSMMSRARPGRRRAGARAVVFGAALATLVAASAGSTAETTRALAVSGLDPVLLVGGQEVAGDPLLAVVHAGLLYRFDSDRTRRAFVAEPGRFAAQLGGACARMGAGVDGQPDLFAVEGGRLYLFGTEQCRDAFLEHPERYLLPPLPPLEPTGEERRAARELLEKAAAALSNRPLRRLAGYRVVGAVERGAGATAFELWLSLDGAVWRKRSIGGEVSVEIWDGSTGALSSRGGTGALSEPARIELLEEAARFDALTLLRGLDLERLTATVEVPDEPGPTRLVRVELPRGAGAGTGLAEGAAEQVVLEIDRHSGRVTSLHFRGRGPGGRAGWITRRFDDFRAAGELFVPFRREDTFEGRDEPFQVTRIERLDPERLDPGRLSRELPVPSPENGR